MNSLVSSVLRKSNSIFWYSSIMVNEVSFSSANIWLSIMCGTLLAMGIPRQRPQGQVPALTSNAWARQTTCPHTPHNSVHQVQWFVGAEKKENRRLTAESWMKNKVELTSRHNNQHLHRTVRMPNIFTENFIYINLILTISPSDRCSRHTKVD